MSNHVVNGLEEKLSDIWQRNLPWFYFAVGILLLTVIFSVSGAFDTDELPLYHRLVLWLVVSILVIVQTVALDHWLPGLLPKKWTWGIIAFIGVILITVCLMTIELHLLKFTPLLPKEPDPLFEFAVFLSPMVSSISAFTILVKNQVAGSIYDDVEIRSDDTPDQLPIDEWPSGSVLTVNAQDHYLYLTTEHEPMMIRGRMRDAVKRLADVDGYRVHRSWWIASAEISEIKRHGRDYSILLQNGAKVPIGRSRINDLRKTGLI